ncbi:PIG-L family deacetylase [Haliangium sp.]|uniref:PIG-L family deacetylase n=1 Tax=Haliangium sp. TaxID=2663208 RepID=UPI003D13CDF9
MAAPLPRPIGVGDLRGRRVLGLFAHPDDEVLAAGLLALAARAGAAVGVVCATAGEAGEVREPERFAGQALAEVRRHELVRSCAALGAGAPVVLGLPDGDLDGLGDDALAGALAPHLSELGPADVTVTLGLDGAYGHRDHIALSRAASAAVAARRRECQPRLLLVEHPAGMFKRLWRTMRRVRPGLIAGALAARDLGRQAAQVDLRVDVSDVWPAKRAAIAAHASQLVDGRPESFLTPALDAAAWAHLAAQEWYRVAAGPALPAGARDPFAGLSAPVAGLAAPART